MVRLVIWDAIAPIWRHCYGQTKFPRTLRKNDYNYLEAQGQYLANISVGLINQHYMNVVTTKGILKNQYLNVLTTEGFKKKKTS